MPGLSHIHSPGAGPRNWEDVQLGLSLPISTGVFTYFEEPWSNYSNFRVELFKFQSGMNYISWNDLKKRKEKGKERSGPQCHSDQWFNTVFYQWLTSLYPLNHVIWNTQLTNKNNSRRGLQFTINIKISVLRRYSSFIHSYSFYFPFSFF